MKVLAVLLFGFVAASQGLECWRCNAARSYDECEANGEMVTCLSNQQSCETVIRRGDQERIEITKQCKQALACENNQKQNTMPSGSSYQCNNDQVHSVCHCCCTENGCNADELCQTTGGAIQSDGGQYQCDAVESFAHGKYHCDDDNNFNSKCVFECIDEEYSVYPRQSIRTTASSKCKSNGQWKPAIPCCARPCPKYVLLDFASLIHNTYDESQELINTIMGVIAEQTVVADDAARFSMTYYSGSIIEENVVFFNDYTDMQGLVIAAQKYRRVNTADGEVNVGYAIRYAVDNMLTEEKGARVGLVGQVLAVYTDEKPTDAVEAISAGAYARSKGIKVYVFELLMPGTNIDRETSLAIAGERDHVFAFNPMGTERELMDLFKDLALHFCQNPCDHVLHDHE